MQEPGRLATRPALHEEWNYGLEKNFKTMQEPGRLATRPALHEEWNYGLEKKLQDNARTRQAGDLPGLCKETVITMALKKP